MLNERENAMLKVIPIIRVRNGTYFHVTAEQWQLLR
jgi:hypothetical protein